MKIVRANIFGFGKWVDASLEFPEQGPVFFYGENESGKSTFHQFILFMLFGLPPKQRKFYQPKTSSKLGGQLVLFDREIGEFTIERFDDKHNGAAICLMESGEVFDETWLKERLQGMNQKTYAAIFSFSALDLNDIQQMDEGDLGEVLLSIGLTGSDYIYQIEKQLDTRLSELFRPQGKNPIINKQLQTLNELAEQLTQKQKEEASYREKYLEAERLAKHLDELQLEKQQAVKENNFITKQRTALPVIQEYQFLARKQQGYMKDVSFPESGLARLEKIKEELRPLESRLAVLKDNKDKNMEQWELLKRQRLNTDLQEEIKQKQQATEMYLVLEKDITELQNKQTKRKSEITEELDNLHIPLTQIDLEELALPFYIEETWKQLKADKEMLAMEAANLESEERGLMEEQKYLENELNYQSSLLLPDEKVNTMENKLHQGKEYAQLEQLYEASVVKDKHFKKDKEEKRKKANHMLAVSILLFILGLAAAYLIDQRFLYGLSFIIIIIGISQWFFTQQNARQLEELLQIPHIERKEAISQVEIVELEKRLMEETNKHREMERLQTALDNQNIKLVKWEEKQRIFFEKNNRHLKQLEEQYLLYPYLQEINISYWPEYYQRLKTLLKWNEEYYQAAAEIEDINDRKEQLKREVLSFMQKHFPEQQQKILTGILEYLENIQQEEQQTMQRLSHYNEQLIVVNEEVNNLEKSISVYREEIEKLFAIAHTTSEEAFYRLANYTAEKAELEKAIEMNKRQLDAAFPDGRWNTFIEDQFDTTELEQAQDAMEGRIAELDQMTEDRRSELAEIHAELKRLESSEALSEKMHQFEMEKENLNQLAKEWAMIKVEKEVLFETKQKYRDKYLSKVMEETAQIFHIVTAGKYESVYSPSNKEPFRLMGMDGIRYTVNELSQGTMNQLYVSLRLAISKVMTERHQLPFILDDAFVHFDAVRVKRMIEVLTEIAAKQQVIMFTCKNDVRDVCEELKIPYMKL